MSKNHDQQSSSNAVCDEIADDLDDKKHKCSPGIVFMSTIPYYMTVRRIKDIFQQYGEVGRIYLQPDTKLRATGKKKKTFVEGWIEFKDKDIAKRVAASMNGAMVGASRRSKARDCLWNLKYLHRFKWIHLTEQLTYEKAVRRMKMLNEISQAKRAARFFAENIDKGKRLKKLEETVLKKQGKWEAYQRQLQQRTAVKPSANATASKELLSSIFA